MSGAGQHPTGGAPFSSLQQNGAASFRSSGLVLSSSRPDKCESLISVGTLPMSYKGRVLITVLGSTFLFVWQRRAGVGAGLIALAVFLANPESFPPLEIFFFWVISRLEPNYPELFSSNAEPTQRSLQRGCGAGSTPATSADGRTGSARLSCR